MSHTALIVLATLLMIPGIIGILIPAIPGIPYMLVIALVFGSIDRWQHLQGAEIGWLAALAVLSLVVDYAAGILGARFGGASKKALTFGFIGMIIGTIILPPFGGLLGLFCGIMLAELARAKNHVKALKAATGGVMGALAGMAVNLMLAVFFLILFIIFSLR